MKNAILYLSFFFTTSVFSQAEDLKKGELFNGLYIITGVDSNEVYKWIGTERGIFRVNKKKNTKKFYSLSASGCSASCVTAIYCESDGCVWIATNNGLFKYDNYAFISFNTENSELPENLITGVGISRHNDLWISTKNHGMLRMYRNRFRPCAENDTSVQNIAIDKLPINNKD
jgi:hypothetical protein